MRDGLTALERAVLSALLSADHPVMAALRTQANAAYVIARDFTGHGFFARFGVPSQGRAASVRPGVLDPGDVSASVQGLDHGAGIVLFVENGVLRTLEGFAYDEPWPDRIEDFQVAAGGVHHIGVPTDLEKVEAALLSGDIAGR